MGGPTESWTRNGSEWPSDAAVCSLSDVLEATRDVPQRFFLSPRACAGILRRAEKRGKALPELLSQALRQVAGNAEPDAAAVLCVALDLNARQCLELYEACGIPTPDPVWQAVQDAAIS